MAAIDNIQCQLDHDSSLLERGSGALAADLNRYTPYQANRQRVISIVSSSISIFAGVVGIYFFLAIGARKRVFRHHLIIFLILYDWVKAICLLLYPARVMATSNAYYNIKFCKIVGFFTAFAIEGSDLAIFSFAIHLALLIYRPKARVKRGINYEGGLYRYRHIVYPVSILLPILLASLAFIDDMGYAPLTNWCYIPSRPIWYRLVLSWIPRYIIMVSIIAIYISIYIHVTKQYRHVRSTIESNTSTYERRSRFRRLKALFCFNFRLTGDDQENDNRSLEENLNDETIQQFNSRRMQTEKHLRTIFIYPIAYVFLWIFPTIVHGMDFRYGLSIRPYVWLNGIAAFMQPFNCAIDTLVFLIREKPWRITTFKVDVPLSQRYDYPRWRKLMSFLPLFKLPDTLGSKHVDHLEMKHEVIGIENVNSHDFSSIISGAMYNNNAGKDFENDKQVNSNENNSPFSKSTVNSGVFSTLGGKQGNNDVSSNNKNTLKQPVPSYISNDKDTSHTGSSSEIEFEDFLRSGPN